MNPFPHSLTAGNAWPLAGALLILLLGVPGTLFFFGTFVRSASLKPLVRNFVTAQVLIALLWFSFGRMFASPGLADSAADATSLGSARGVPDQPLNAVAELNSPSRYVRGPCMGTAAQAKSENLLPPVSGGFTCSFYGLACALFAAAAVASAAGGRIKFHFLLPFLAGWFVFGYLPLSHMSWGADGDLNGLHNPMAEISSIDFEGSMVTRLAAALSASLLLFFFSKDGSAGSHPVQGGRLWFCLAGQAMLSLGSIGFCGGQALEVGKVATAAVSSILASLAASFVWVMADLDPLGKPTNARFVLGPLAGLCAIGPAAGLLTATGAVITGLAAGLASMTACFLVQRFLGRDGTAEALFAITAAIVAGMLLLPLLPTNAVIPGLSVTNQAKSLFVTSAFVGGISIGLALLLKGFEAAIQHSAARIAANLQPEIVNA